MDQFNKAERRAFDFGTAMRRQAREHCGGSLHDAYQRFSTPARVAQQEADVAAIRPEHRSAYSRMIREADGTY